MLLVTGRQVQRSVWGSACWLERNLREKVFPPFPVCTFTTIILTSPNVCEGVCYMLCLNKSIVGARIECVCWGKLGEINTFLAIISFFVSEIYCNSCSLYSCRWLLLIKRFSSIYFFGSWMNPFYMSFPVTFFLFPYQPVLFLVTLLFPYQPAPFPVTLVFPYQHALSPVTLALPYQPALASFPNYLSIPISTCPLPGYLSTPC